MTAARQFQLHLLLLDGETHTAAELAGALGTSRRTVYREIDRLSAAGLPVEGSAGIGYRLRATPALPPLVLGAEEMRALVPPRSRARYGLQS